MKEIIKVITTISMGIVPSACGVEEGLESAAVAEKLRFVHLKLLMETKEDESLFLCIGKLKKKSESKIVWTFDLVEAEVVKFPSRWRDEAIAQAASEEKTGIGVFAIRRRNEDPFTLEMKEFYPSNTSSGALGSGNGSGVFQKRYSLSFISLKSTSLLNVNDYIISVGEIRDLGAGALFWVELYGLPNHELKAQIKLSADFKKSEKPIKGSGAAILHVESIVSETIRSDLGDFEVRTPKFVLKEFYPYESRE